MTPAQVTAIERAVVACRDEAIALVQQLIRHPSVNTPPTGAELAVQRDFARILVEWGLAVETIDLTALPGFADHPGCLHAHDLHDRPDVVGVLPGIGGGRSLMLVAHADVELPGEPSLWMGGDPFSGLLCDGRIYGRGAGDDKSGMAISAMVVRVLQRAGMRLRGNLIIASVSDEEQAGSNGAAALACTSYRADACINIDGVENEVSLANLGGGNCTVEFHVPDSRVDATELLDYFSRFRARVAAFRRRRMQRFTAHPYYAVPPGITHCVRVMDVKMAVELNTHGSCLVWFYLLPGEDPVDLQQSFEEAVAGLDGPGEHRIRWMPRFLLPSEVSEDHPFAQAVCSAYERATGRPPVISGAMMSDMGMLNHYVVSPTVCFGPSRWGGEGGAHQVDEYIEVKCFLECLKTVVLTAADWCGIADNDDGVNSASSEKAEVS